MSDLFLLQPGNRQSSAELELVAQKIYASVPSLSIEDCRVTAMALSACSSQIEKHPSVDPEAFYLAVLESLKNNGFSPTLLVVFQEGWAKGFSKKNLTEA